jgi:cupin 2 domain-containing protein
MISDNLFNVSALLPGGEFVETLVGSKGVRIERIISSGQASPAGFWYDQAEDEWVAVLQGNARIQWEDGSEAAMNPGDWLLIPAYQKHRVESASAEPPCIWLAVFCNSSMTTVD